MSFRVLGRRGHRLGGGSVDIAHLTFRPPEATGSFNRLVAAQLRQLSNLHQVSISYAEVDGQLLLSTDDKHLRISPPGVLKRQALKVFASLRRGEEWIRDVDRLAYAMGAIQCLRSLQPRLIVCYDEYKLGRILRGKVSWPCRLVLSQRGFSYNLAPNGAGRALYSLDCFDAVVTMSVCAYAYDAARIHAYEPSLYVVPNCVDTDHFRPLDTRSRDDLRRECGFRTEDGVVLCLGRQVPKKGAHLIVESWPRVLQARPTALLWIVGPGEPRYWARMVRTADALGVRDRVRFTGPVLPRDAARCYQAADAYVFPTLCQEGQGKALLEAMACGLPCISSAFGTAVEHYSPDEVILVPNPNLCDAFVEPIVRILGCRHLRYSLSRAARRAAVERFSEREVFPLLEQFYRRQLEMVTG